MSLRILWVTPQFPCRRSGGQVRQYHLLQYLGPRHQVTVLSLIQPTEVEEIPSLWNTGVEVITVPFSSPKPSRGWRNRIRSWAQLLFDPQPHYARTYPLPALRAEMAKLLSERKPDIVHLEHLFTAPLGEMLRGLPWLLTEHNVESTVAERQRRRANTPARRLAGWLEARKLRRWERRWIQRSPACIAVSETDAATLRAMSPGTPIFVVPTGVDTAHFAVPEGNQTRRAGMVFFGNLGYAPNIDALAYFCDQIFPLVRSRHPDARLHIVGPYAPPEVVALGSRPGIQYIGFVEDVRPHLWQAAVCIVPLRVGGGVRLKILEALAAGCPVVSTTVGAEGLDLSDGQDLLIGDDPLTFAQHVSELLEDGNKARHLAEHGRQTVSTRYDWRTIAPRLEEAYRTVLRAGH